MFFTLNKTIYHAVQLHCSDSLQSLPSAWMRYYCSLRYLLQWGFLGFAAVFSCRPLPVLAQSGVPFPAGTGTDGIAGDATLDSQAWISEVVGTFDTLWDTCLSIDLPYFAQQLISFIELVLYRDRWLWVCLLVIKGTDSFVLNRSFLRMAFGTSPPLECPFQR